RFALEPPQGDGRRVQLSEQGIDERRRAAEKLMLRDAGETSDAHAGPLRRHVLAERRLDVFGLHALAVVQAVENAVDDLFRLVLFEILDKSVEKVLARERVIDLGFLVVIL